MESRVFYGKRGVVRYQESYYPKSGNRWNPRPNTWFRNNNRRRLAAAVCPRKTSMQQQLPLRLPVLALAGALLVLTPFAARGEDAKPAAKPAAPAPKSAPKGSATAGADAKSGARRKAIEALNLTEDQKAQLKKLRAENRKHRQEIESSTKLTEDQKKAQLKTAREEQQKKFQALLTPEQRKKWETVRPGAKKGGAAKAAKKADTKK